MSPGKNKNPLSNILLSALIGVIAMFVTYMVGTMCKYYSVLNDMKALRPPVKVFVSEDHNCEVSKFHEDGRWKYLTVCKPGYTATLTH